jgi:hypothetical protein
MVACFKPPSAMLWTFKRVMTSITVRVSELNPAHDGRRPSGGRARGWMWWHRTRRHRRARRRCSTHAGGRPGEVRRVAGQRLGRGLRHPFRPGHRRLADVRRLDPERVRPRPGDQHPHLARTGAGSPPPRRTGARTPSDRGSTPADHPGEPGVSGLTRIEGRRPSPPTPRLRRRPPSVPHRPRNVPHARRTFGNDHKRPATAWQAIVPRDAPRDGCTAVALRRRPGSMAAGRWRRATARP